MIKKYDGCVVHKDQRGEYIENVNNWTSGWGVKQRYTRKIYINESKGLEDFFEHDEKKVLS